MTISSGNQDSIFQCEELNTSSQNKVNSLSYQDAMQVMKLIDADDVDSLRKIVEKYGEDFTIPVSFKNQYDPIFYAIYNQKIATLGLLFEVYGHERFLAQLNDGSKLNPLFFSVYYEKTDSLKFLVESYGYENFLYQVYSPGDLNPVFFAIYFEKLNSIEKFIEIYQDNFMRLNTFKYPYNPLFFALCNCKSESFIKIAEELNDGVLSTISDTYKDNIIVVALREYLKYDERDELRVKQKGILEYILKKSFGEDIDVEDKINKLEQFYYSFSYLRSGFSFDDYNEYENSFLKSKKYLENLLPLGNPLLFKEISEVIYNYTDNYLPIKIISKQNPENLFIFTCKLSDHSSFLIFHVNPQLKCIEAITSIDGNGFYEGRSIENEPDNIYAVTKFTLNSPVYFDDDKDAEKIIKDFIQKNTQGKSAIKYWQDLLSGEIEFCSQKIIESSKIENFLKTQRQYRGNCEYKSDKILQKYLFQVLNPAYSFDDHSEKKLQNAKKLFKEYKIAMRDVAIENLENLTRDLDLQDKFDNFLLIEKDRLLQIYEKKMQEKEAKHNLKLLAKIASIDSSSPESLKRASSLISSESSEDLKPDVLPSSLSGEQLSDREEKKSRN